MNFDAFIESLKGDKPAVDISPPLAALWHSKKGDWRAAHAIAQDGEDDASALVHAHLHREEGDIGNARYWYSRAGRPFPHDSLDAEWLMLVKEFTTPASSSRQ